MRAPNWMLVGLFMVGAACAAPGDWEVRGDTFLQAGNYQRALLAYETALEAAPNDKGILTKYKNTYLLVLSEQKVEADAGRTSPLNRMGARPKPPEPTPAPEGVPGEAGMGTEAAADAPEATGDETPGTGESGEKPAGEGSTEAAGDGDGATQPPADTIRVREDGTIELRFGQLNRMGARGGANRMGAAGGDPEEGGEPEEEEGPPKPAVYGGGQTVSVSQPKLGFEGSQGDEVDPENTVIQTSKYRIENVKLSYRGRNLEVQGKLTNVSGTLIKLPRVYVSIFDVAGTLRGRNFGYISPGRNLLARGATKSFKVDFRGYSDPVASYRIEVIP